MAAITVTAANVLASANAVRVTNPDGTPTRFTASGTFTAGKLACQLADGTFDLCDADGATPLYTPVGIFENSGSANQVCSIVKKDPLFKTGATMTVGNILIAGGTAGAINPSADATTPWHITVVGVVMTTTELDLDLGNGVIKTVTASPAI